MGLPSTIDANEGIQLCVFDSRRGQHEGQELDKILFFYPPDCPYSVQLSVIGLSGGMITFTRLFSPDAACEVIEAERHSHVFYQAEPDIWMVLIVEKIKDSESIWRCDALQDILKEIHSLFMMFNGSLQNILDKQPSGALARSCLYTFITDYLTASMSHLAKADFRISKKIRVPTFRDCLKERRTVQMLTISREVAIEVQSLATVIGSSCIGGITCNSIILFQDLLVSTTLSPGDTANMFTYAVLRLTPHALSSKTSSWSYLRKGVSSSNVTVRSASLNTGSSLEDDQDGSCNTSPRGQGQTYHTVRLLQIDKWSKGKDGFLVSGIHGEVGNLVNIPPIVWLQQTEEQVYLCVYQHRNLTIIFLIPVCTLIDGETGISHAKKQFLENASEKIVYVEEKLSKGFGGENAYHVSGYRYLLVDRDRSISRASPPGKVTTLAKDSLLAFNNLRDEVDLKKARANREKPGCENNFEMCIRAKNNAWLIAKVARGRELYMVLEKANETLLYASDAVEKFSNRYCDGAFSLD